MAPLKLIACVIVIFPQAAFSGTSVLRKASAEQNGQSQLNSTAKPASAHSNRPVVRKVSVETDDLAQRKGIRQQTNAVGKLTSTIEANGNAKLPASQRTRLHKAAMTSGQRTAAWDIPKEYPSTLLRTSSINLPVFVLNMDRRVDRLKGISHVLASQAPELFNLACRVAAPDGSRMIKEGYKPLTSIVTPKAWATTVENVERHEAITGHDLTPGAISLIMGVGLILEHFLQGYPDAKMALVFEDDVSDVHPQAVEWIRSAVDGKHNDLPKGEWGAIQLCGYFVDKKSTELVVYNSSMFTTCAWMITKEAAKQLLERQFPIGKRGAEFQFDDISNPFRNLKTWYLWPQSGSTLASGLFTQQGSAHDSDVQIHSLIADSNTPKLIPNCSELEVKHMTIPDLCMGPGARCN